MTKLGFALKKAKYGFEARMTLHIVTAVVIVSLIMTAIAASMFQKEYEQQLNHELDDAIETTDRLIDEQISKIEVSANTAAQLYDYKVNKKDDIDSILIHSLKGNPVQVAATVILDRESYNNEKLFSALSINGEIGIINITNLKDQLTGDDSWEHSYIKEEKYWSMPYQYQYKDTTILNIVTYSVPIYNNEGKKCGIYCSSITLDWLSELVMQSKITDSIDVTIKTDDGKYLVEPGPIINGAHEKDLIIKSDYNERLGWTFITSSPRSTITHCVWIAVWKIVAFATLLIIILCISVIYNVRHIARPYVRENAVIARDKAAVDKELSLAAAVQRKLLTDASSQGDKYQLNALLHPAKNIGGDLYDYTVFDNKIYFCIGDVAGKGMPASLFMGMTTVLFRHAIKEQTLTSPADIVSTINNSLSLDNKDCMFVTLFVGRLDLMTGEFTYCNAGHNAPLLDGIYLSGSSGLPVGIEHSMPYDTERIMLEHGSTIVLYTDGVTEAMNPNGQLYGDERLKQLVNNLNGDSEAITQSVLESVRQHADGAEQSDDITLLCIRYK